MWGASSGLAVGSGLGAGSGLGTGLGSSKAGAGFASFAGSSSSLGTGSAMGGRTWVTTTVIGTDRIRPVASRASTRTKASSGAGVHA